MQAIFIICAIVIFIAGVVIVRNSLKTGKFLDRSDDPKIADTWVLRSQNPRRFWFLIFSFILAFGSIIVCFSCLAIIGTGCLGVPGSD